LGDLVFSGGGGGEGGAVEGDLSDRYIFPYEAIGDRREGEEYNEDTMASKQKHID